MKAQFKLDIRETFDGNLMIKELRNPDCTIPHEDSVSITILKRKTSTEEEIIKAFIHDHSVTDIINKFIIVKDGRYVVTHAIVPTEQWLEKQTNLTQYNRILIYTENGLSEYSNGRYTEVDPTELEDESLVSSNVQTVCKDIFVLFNLWQCYLNYCKKLFEGECSKNSKCDDSCDDELTQNRNLIWLFLNAIQYLVKLGRIEEAQELLEEISGGCNVLCSNEMFSKEYDCNCG